MDMMRMPIALVVVFCLLWSATNALYFKLTPGMKKWFTDDVIEGSMLKSIITIEDEIPLLSENDGVISTIFHPKLKEVNKKVIGGKSGIHTIIASMSGIHKIWLEGTKQLFSILPVQELKVSIKILDEKELDKKLVTSLDTEDLKESRDILLQIMTKTSELLIEQEYEQKKEDMFVDYKNSLISKIFWLALVQISVFILASIWIIWSLKNFMSK